MNNTAKQEHVQHDPRNLSLELVPGEGDTVELVLRGTIDKNDLRFNGRSLIAFETGGFVDVPDVSEKFYLAVTGGFRVDKDTKAALRAKQSGTAPVQRASIATAQAEPEVSNVIALPTPEEVAVPEVQEQVAEVPASPKGIARKLGMLVPKKGK